MVKVIMQYDHGFLNITKFDLGEAIKTLFWDFDHGNAHADIMLWETHSFLPAECASDKNPILQLYTEQGIDIMQIIIDETHKRGMKAYWHHRFCEVSRMDSTDPVCEKVLHPDWTIDTWECTMWNLAAPGLRQFKLDYFRRILSKYKFDGMCIDFLRHLPCLPVGEQWEYRECATDFMRGVRKIVDELCPDMKLGAKLPENGRACKVDGFDVETWSNERILDFIIAGSRSSSSDVKWYKSITEGTDIEIYPGWDTWHASDASHWLDESFYRGVFHNWITQGADGIVGFNYIGPPKDVAAAFFCRDGSRDLVFESREFRDICRQIKEAYDLTTVKCYAAERRGGYPYGTGAGGTNCFAPLPLRLEPGVPTDLPMQTPHTENLKLRLVISGEKPTTKFVVKLNGVKFTQLTEDHEHIDDRIWWPKPQYNSGAHKKARTPTPSNLLEMYFEVPDGVFTVGDNVLTVCATHGCNVERAELTYTPAK